MMTYDLPADLEEEIFSRVPATSLKRLRSTCKRWNALFKDGRFIEKHFRKAPKQSRVLMLNAYSLRPMSVDLNVVPPSVEIKDALGLKDSHSNSEPVDIAQVFYCDGLLLCITGDNKPVVCNPCLGDTRWIQHKYGYDEDCRFALGYEENNQSCRIYKTLMFWECDKTNNPDGGFEIYEFSSNSWRVVIAPNYFSIRGSYRSVTLKGNTYWISYDDNQGIFLLSFDFTRERFRRLRLPTFQNRVYHMALSVVREEELSVLCVNRIGSSYELEMWVTKKIDTEAEFSWSKSFAVDLHTHYLFSVSASLLTDEKVVLCSSIDGYRVYVIGEDGKYYTQTLDPESTNKPCHRCPFIFNYVPSLVQIQ